MAWKMIGEPKTRKLTKTLADEFSNMTPAPHDRPLNSTRAAILRKVFDMGKFRTCEWAKAYCEQTKQTYRINGKHTSTVLSTMNGSFPKHVSVIVEEYKCDTLEDVAQLYATFDTRASVRSTGDINQIFAATVPGLDDVIARIINLAVTGIAYSIWEDAYFAHPADERAQLIISGSDFCLWLNELLGNCGTNKVNHIRRSPVAAAMYKTWLKSKSDATAFWTAVRDETGTKPTVADRKLAKFLIACRLHSSKASNGQSAGNREVYVKCIHAWNAWRSGAETSLAFYADAKTPAAK